MLPLIDAPQGILEIQRIGAQRMGRHLPMEHLRRQIGVIGGQLAPARRPTFRRRPHDTDEFVAKGLQPRDPHRIPIRSDRSSLTPRPAAHSAIPDTPDAASRRKALKAVETVAGPDEELGDNARARLQRLREVLAARPQRAA